MDFWNVVSVRFDREIALAHDKRGANIIPMFLDNILHDSCSEDVVKAFDRAVRTTIAKSTRQYNAVKD